jgi:hypothetical protein
MMYMPEPLGQAGPKQGSCAQGDKFLCGRFAAAITAVDFQRKSFPKPMFWERLLRYIFLDRRRAWVYKKETHF